MSNIIDILRFKKDKAVEVSQPHKPTIDDIIGMYEMSALTAEEAIQHLNDHNYLHQLLMQVIIQSHK